MHLQKETIKLGYGKPNSRNSVMVFSGFSQGDVCGEGSGGGEMK